MRRKTKIHLNTTTTHYTAQVLNVSDYYSFGSEIAERSYDPVKPKYRYGFNTQEKVLEINKDHYTAKFWEYDARLGRRWNVDPKPDVNWSVYSTLYDNPVKNVDWLGDKPLDDYTAKKDGTIEVKKTNDKFDRFLVEDKDGKINEVYRVDKPNTDKQSLVRFPDEGKGFTRYGDPDNSTGGDHYVKPEVAAALFGAVNDFSNKYPDTKVQFGDMSNRFGQRPNKTHKTHSGGRNVDFRYIRKDGALKPVNVNSPALDVTKTQDLINSFYKYGFNNPKSIGSFPNKQGFLFDKTFKLSGHDDHGHLQNFNLK